jgi:glycosyltransferase involved in cell wall biosynthesis
MDRDYTSPNLETVMPDRCFPRMRAGDRWSHPWKYLRREVPHLWYADERYPLMGFMNRDEATLLHNIALRFRGQPALEIGSWLGWSTCHIALAGVEVDVIDPAHADPEFRAIVEESLARCGVSGRVNLTGGRSPDDIGSLAAARGGKWSLFIVDGDHEGAAPVEDTAACLPYAADSCAFVFHDLASPDVAAALKYLEGEGFQVLVYQTAQIMGLAWRGDVTPVEHTPDPEVVWQLPHHLVGWPVAGVELGMVNAERRTRNAERREQPLLNSAFCVLRSEFTDRLPSVCIVTNEVIGPFRNGGIGTSMTGLAITLAAAGHKVTVLYTGGIWNPDTNLRHWKGHYAQLGIELEALTLDDMRSIAGPLKDCGYGTPWLVDRYLRAHPFDVVHFNDCCGEGVFALAAKRLGLAFHETLLVVALHSPSQWVLELNHTPANLLLAAYNYAERLSVRSADVAWSPSRYMLEWVRKQGFILPRTALLQQYVLPPRPAPVVVTHGATAPPKRIVFFGRLEERKGLRLFCNAIDALRGELGARETEVVFLGKPATVAGMDSLDYIASRSRRWRFPVKTLTTLGQPEALDLLRGEGTLAVMPSPLDNSPCTVYEALACGVPFLAANTGGIGELIHADDRERVLFDYTSPALVAALYRALHDGGFVARPSVPQDETRQQWTALHANWRSLLPAPRERAAVVEVVAVIDHRPQHDLDVTLRSLEACEGIRRIVVLNRGGRKILEPPPALLVRNLDLLIEDAESLDAELAAENAVLLIHSGVAVIPEAFAAMRAALGCEGVDGLVPAAALPGAVIPSLGGSPSFALYRGLTFTGGMLVRGEALLAAKWRRPYAVESAFLGLADFCVTRGIEIWPYPAPVFQRSEEETPELGALPIRLAAYDDASAVDRYYMLATGYGAATGVRSTGHRRRLAVAVANLGLGSLLRGAWWGLQRAKRLRAFLRRRR